MQIARLKWHAWYSLHNVDVSCAEQLRGKCDSNERSHVSSRNSSYSHTEYLTCCEIFLEIGILSTMLDELLLESWWNQEIGCSKCNVVPTTGWEHPFACISWICPWPIVNSLELHRISCQSCFEIPALAWTQHLTLEHTISLICIITVYKGRTYGLSSSSHRRNLWAWK